MGSTSIKGRQGKNVQRGENSQETGVTEADGFRKAGGVGGVGAMASRTGRGGNTTFAGMSQTPRTK